MSTEFKKGLLGLKGKYTLIITVSVFLVGFSLLAYSYFSLKGLSAIIKDDLINKQREREIQIREDALRDRISSEALPYLKPNLLKPSDDELTKLKEDFSASKNFSYFLVLNKDKNYKAPLISFSITPELLSKLDNAQSIGNQQNNRILQIKDGSLNPKFMEISFPIKPEPTAEPEGFLILGYNYEEIESHLQGIKQQYMEISKTVQEVVEDRVRNIQYYSVMLTLLILTLSMLVATMLSAKTIKPLKDLQNTMQIVENEQDLTHTVEITSSDEVGSLANTLNSMINKLKMLVGNVQDASLHVGSCSSELLAASEQISRGAKNQAKHIEDTSSAVTELSASIQQVAVNAKKATDTAQKGESAVNDVIENMNRIKKTVADTSEKIKELGQRSKEIGKIVSAITQISDQTSLLALNAAIEAARAGEQGRGFAVVADEVSKLAVKASLSAKEIDELISDIKDKTDESVNSMHAAFTEVETGSNTITLAGKNFLAIIDFVQETATAVQEQAKAFEEISHSMNEVLNIAKETVSATDEAVVQGNELRELAEKLEDLIKRFKVTAVK